MDITEKSPTVLSFCSGYGGIELGIERVLGPLRVLAHVEIEAFAIANLVSKMETGRMVPAPIWTDLKTIALEPFRGRVDILMGGYPCQPFSAAGKRLGTEDPRHLWPFILKAIKSVRPRACFFENVEGHISLGLREVITDMERIGYTVKAGIFSAAEVGAPHQRKRVFILAHDTSQRIRLDEAEWEGWKALSRGSEEVDELAHCCGDGCSGGTIQNGDHSDRVQESAQPLRSGQSVVRSETEGRSHLWPSRPGEPQYEWEEPRVVSDTEGGGTRGGQELCEADWGQVGELFCESDTSNVRQSESVRQQEPGQVEGCPPEPPDGWPVEQAQPQLGRAPDGTRDRVDRLRLLGNGVVPQTAEKAFRTLLQRF